MTQQADLDAFRDRVRWMWSQGDYTLIAPLLQPCADELAEAIGLGEGMEVLDIAAGTGNFSIAAATRGARVTATDLTPLMIELGSKRTQGVTPAVTWREADAEALPFADATFDVVASVFGAMFAPRHERVAAEMFRVVKPEGSWAWPTALLRAFSPACGTSWRSTLHHLRHPFPIRSCGANPMTSGGGSGARWCAVTR